MVKAIRRIVFSLAVVLFVVAGIIALRTTLYRSRQITPATGAPALQLQTGAVERFTAAIQLKTISAPTERRLLARNSTASINSCGLVFRALTQPLAEKLSENTVCFTLGKAGIAISNRYCSWGTWMSSRWNPTARRSGATRPSPAALPMVISGPRRHGR